MESVCAVVVTYNRKSLLIECLEALRTQTRPVQGIVILDNNSTDGTPELLLERGYISELPPNELTEPWEHFRLVSNYLDKESIKVHYVRMSENTGGAGGFHHGVRIAFENNYDWIWVMDDDCEPQKETLERLLYNANENISCLCPVIVHKHSGEVEYYHHKVFNSVMDDTPVLNSKDIEDFRGKVLELDANAFGGPLIRRSAIGIAGFPEASLFIWGDDTEYTHRIKKKVGKVVLVGSSIMYHKDNPYQKVISKQHISRVYYFYRNRLWLIKSYARYNLLAYLYWLYRSIRHSLSLLLKHNAGVSSFIPLKGFFAGIFKTYRRK
uniref:Glycosyltransferase n=1 Tax=Fervidobacterium pennivorans TaxID=93466 RepID=A0A7V4KF35_FERPE